MSLTLEMPKNSPKKRKSRWGFLFLLIILISMGSFCYWIYAGRIVSNNGELSAGFVPVVAPMSSALAEILVEPNAYVQTGQLLAKLEGGDYINQIAAAKALVQGTLTQGQSTAEQVAMAQKDAEEMVERIALARHEENARRHEVEKLSTEHAQALLAMRDLDAKGGSESEKDAAKKAERDAELKLQNAKSSFEFASTSRVAIETELHKIRDSKDSATNTEPMVINLPDPTLIHAPINGYLTKNIPLAGQMFNKDDAVLQIIPEVGAKLYALALLPNEDAKKIKTNMLCFVLPNNAWTAFSGKVVSVDFKEEPASISINLNSEIDASKFSSNNATKTVFWNHPLVDNSFLYPIFMLLSYLP